MTYLDRVLADSRDRAAWLAARRSRITASTAAKLSKPESIYLYLAQMLRDGDWSGNSYTRHGNDLEPALLRWARIPQNTLLFHAEGEDRFAATPDGIEETASGELVLAQVKTTVKPFKTIPLAYRRQVWWEQYVMGATRTKFIWDLHDGSFDMTSLEPHVELIERDDAEIDRMLAIARPLHDLLTEALAFERDVERTAA